MINPEKNVHGRDSLITVEAANDPYEQDRQGEKNLEHIPIKGPICLAP